MTRHIIQDAETYFIILLKRIKKYDTESTFLFGLIHAFVYRVLIKYFRLPFSAIRF